ncbi:MAG: S8 family serine peptidase [Actinomycetota bacterium]
MTKVIGQSIVRRMRRAGGRTDADQVLKSVAVGAVSVLTLGVLALPRGGAETDVAEDRPPAPEVLAATSGEPVRIDDGLLHLIITPTGAPDGGTIPIDPAADEADARPEAGSDAAIGATDGESAWTIDGGRGQLVLVDGELMRRDADGDLVPAGADVAVDADPTPGHDPSPSVAVASFGHPTIDALAERDGVESIVAIGDGSFAVAVDDRSVLDGLPVEANEDTPLALFADPYESYQWALENTGSNLYGVSGAPPQTADADIDVTTAWASATGAGVVVAVIDSGVDFSHPDLAPNRWTNPGEVCGNGVDDDANGHVDDCHGWDFAYDDNQPFNPGAHPHGTHVAGIVAAEAGNGIGVAGVAPDAQIMDLNVGRLTPSGEPAISTSSLARAVRYAADNGADIINLSLGTPPGTPRSAMTTLESAILHAGDRGALVVVAAGNDRANLDGANTAWPASYEFPHVVTVAATAPDETLASFSNFGSVVDVAAPGHVILSAAPAANGSYVFMSGTSQATPVVAGVAALALDADPGLHASALRDAIRSTADRHDAYVGRIPDGMRANAGNLVAGTTPEVGFDEVAISVSGLAGANDLEPVTATLDIVVPTDSYDEPFTWNATLVAMESDGDYVVIAHDVAVGDAPRITDDHGAVPLGLAGSGTVDLRTALPQGRYALVLEPIADADPASRLGDAFVAAFDVADGSIPSTTTTVAAGPTPTTTAPPPVGDPSPTTSLAPVPTSLPPVGDPSPTTSLAPVPTSLPPVGDPSPTTSLAPVPTTTQPPGNGSSPTTTTQPPGNGSSPTTTTPTTTTTASPTTTTQPPGGGSSPTTTVAPPPTPTQPPVAAGDWSISAVLPAEGRTDTMNPVRLNGSFPEAAYVWFGEQPGIVIASTPYTIDVLTPIRSTSGVVDIALVPPGSDAVLTAPSAYTFVADGSAPPTEPAPPSDPPSPTTTTAPPTSPSPTTTVAPIPTTLPPVGSTTTTTTAAPSPEPGPSPTTTVAPDPGGQPGPTTTTTVAPGANPSPTTTLAPSPRRPRAALGDQIGLSTGLRGRLITGDSPIGTAPLCTSDPCALT